MLSREGVDEINAGATQKTKCYRALVRVDEEIRKLELRVSAAGLDQVVIHREADEFRSGAES